MDDAKKMLFIAHQTKQALDHMKVTPNHPTPDGKMSHDKMMGFVQAMAKHGLKHFDAGGTVLSGPGGAGTVNSSTNPNTGILGTLGGALGLNNNFQAGAANVQQGTNAAQLNQAYQGTQNALQGQQNLANTLAPQAANAVQSQNQLAAQLQAQANGQGPNVAQAQLNQATGENIAQQAALQAGQRGAGGNAGMIAENAARQGAATQQQSAGQAATLGAQQQIAAQQNLANLAGTQISQAGSAAGNLTGAQQGEQNILQNANTGANNTSAGMQANINNTNAQTSAANAASNAGLFGGILSGASSALSHIFAHGGEVKKYASGGYITGNPLITGMGSQQSAPQSAVGQYLNSPQSAGGPSIEQTQSLTKSSEDLGKDVSGAISNYGAAKDARDAKSQQEFSNTLDENPLQEASAMNDPSQMAYAKGGQIRQMAARGGPVKANNKSEKAVTGGDSYSNDKIPALLSEGEVVMDKDILADKSPIGQMARAVAAHIAKRNKK